MTDEAGPITPYEVPPEVERRVLSVRPHRHREILGLPEELEVGWIVSGRFLRFGACKNREAFDRLCADARSLYGDFDVYDEMPNAGITD